LTRLPVLELPRRLLRSAVFRLSRVAGRVRPDWSPDVAWRYLPIARRVRRTIGPRGSILDVGAGGLGITAYVRNPCVLVDRTRPMTVGPRLVLADARRLPFGDKSFDAVVQADVIEHIPPAYRQEVLNDIFRVARKLVVIAAPAGAGAAAQDRRLWNEAHPDNHLRGFLAEHLEFGVPAQEELVELVRSAAAGAFSRPAIEVQKNANLFLRYLVMRGVVRADDVGAGIRLRLWTPLSPLLAAIRAGACYRLIVACEEREARRAA